MSKGTIFRILAFIACFTLRESISYRIPTPTLELLSPKGFRISIPDESGIVLFAFHGAINRQLRGVQPGDIEGEVREPVNGKWTYENTKDFLDPGDILYYWIHVQHGNQAYRLLDKSVTIPQSVAPNRDSTPLPVTRPTYEDTTPNIFRPQNTIPITHNPNLISTGNCILSKTKVRGGDVCEGALIFEDNFEKGIDWSLWKKEIRIPLDSDDADFVSFQDRLENCYSARGNLVIVPNLLSEVPGFNEERIRTGELELVNCTGIVDVERECRRQAGLFRILPPVVSARIRTKESFTFLYGRVEVRAKLTRGDWLFPQIFLEPYTNEYGISGYSSGQMRIAFIRGNEVLDSKEGNQIDGHRLSGGIVLSTGDTFRDIWLKSSLRRRHLGRDFHNYSLTWTDQEITLAIDGNDYATIRGGFSRLSQTHNLTYATQWENGGYMAPFDKEFYLVLGVSAGGVSDFPDGCRTGSSRQLKPWSNTSPKAELKFWNDRDNWYRTWEGEDAGMEVDYIKVWAL